MNTKANTLIKICGMTREKDAMAALRLGADAIGMLFFEESPRHVKIDQAVEIARAVGDKGLKVGLFVNATTELVREVLAKVPLDILQFHGSESQEYCLQFKRPYWKTLRATEANLLPEQIDQFNQANGILLDTWHPTKHGGTGATFDWSILEGLVIKQHLILAGGLNPENIGKAIAQVKPWAVDVCSGVEIKPGIKSEQLMETFIDEVKRVCTQTP